jgi:methylmalonyl-CoA/ethylmalonyl-CoA epimerase
MTSTDFGLREIGQIAVNARDLKKMTSFYRDTLGLKFLFEAPKMAFFDCAGVRLMLGAPEQKEFDHAPSVLYFRVPDIKAAYDTLMSRGVRFEGKPHSVARMPDHELWMAFFRDVENNVLALMSEVKQS